VHCAIGKQSQDGRADIAALSASASAATAARAAESEAAAGIEAAAAGSEPAEAGLEAGAEGAAVPVCAVLPDVFPEFTTGSSPLLVQCTALLRVEPEAEPTRWWCEWVVHLESP
jgi:hypothetical protein